MKRFFLLLICLGSISLPVSKVEAKSSIYLELLGSGLLYSVNYEYFIKDDMPLGIGLGSPTPTTPVILSLSQLRGKSKHKLELGGGISLPYATLSGVVGYRYQPEVAGPIFRLSFTPLFFALGYRIPYFGISAGFTF